MCVRAKATITSNKVSTTLESMLTLFIYSTHTIQELDSQGYNCPRCKKVFSTLDAGSLLDFTTNTMRCDVCGTDVVDNANTEEVRQSKDQMNRLLGQTKPVIDGLKKTETIPLPA